MVMGEPWSLETLRTQLADVSPQYASGVLWLCLEQALAAARYAETCLSDERAQAQTMAAALDRIAGLWPVASEMGADEVPYRFCTFCAQDWPRELPADEACGYCVARAATEEGGGNRE